MIDLRLTHLLAGVSLCMACAASGCLPDVTPTAQDAGTKAADASGPAQPAASRNQFSRTEITSGNDRYLREVNDGRVTIEIVRGATRRQAVLERQPSAAPADGRATGATALYAIVQLEPPAGTAHELAWLFREFPPEVDLRTADSTRLEHPDRTRMAEILLALSAEAADIDSAVAQCGTLLRYESRAQVFETAAKRLGAAPEAFDRLLDVATSASSALTAPTPGGEEPGGTHYDARFACLAALAENPLATGQRADKLAGAATLIGYVVLEEKLLTLLLDRASVQALASAAATIGGYQARGNVLLAIARRQGLTVEEARILAGTSPRIGFAPTEAELLGLLAAKAPVKTLVDAAVQISAYQSRHEAFLALSKRPNLTTEEANQIATSVPRIGYAPAEAEVLGALVGKAATRAIVDAGVQASAYQSRAQVLLTLAKQPRLARADADLVAGACPRIGFAPSEAEVLVELASTASAQAVVDASVKCGTYDARFKPLQALAAKPGLTVAEADLVARASSMIGFAPHEESLLARLAATAQVETLIDAARQIGHYSSRAGALMAVAGRKSLSREEANRLARAAGSIGYAASEAALLKALIGKASTEQIAASAAAIGSSSERQAVLDALQAK